MNENIEKVLAALDGFRMSDEMTYSAYSALHDEISLLDDLLKAQEPKLLTIEEITGDGECWFEGINGACGYADCYMYTKSKEVEVHRISMKPEYVSWDDFKKKWRCWSARPTDEQRKAAYDERHKGLPGEARELIEDAPSVPAVPLDKLCEWLGKVAIVRCNGCSQKLCTGDACDDCSSSDHWEKEIKKWMEGLDAEKET